MVHYNKNDFLIYNIKKSNMSRTQMEDCKTQEDYAKYFQTYNENKYIKCYCELAKKKLPKVSELQIEHLNQVINGDEVDDRIGWDAYCHILSIEQINYVGW